MLIINPVIVIGLSLDKKPNQEALNRRRCMNLPMTFRLNIFSRTDSELIWQEYPPASLGCTFLIVSVQSS